MFLLLLLGCPPENSLTDFTFNNVTVVAGDFDDIGDPLNRAGVPYHTADGIISTATWDPAFNHEGLALEVEDLFGLPGELSANQAVFVASGTRGLGKRHYNGLDPDDQLVTDSVVVENVRGYVERGGVLVLTDWAYDLVEVAWPDAVEWVNDDLVPDDAQRGLTGELTADVASEEMAERMGLDRVALRFDYSNWAVIESVSDDVDVVLAGPVTWRPSPTEDAVAGEDVPLMISFQPRGASGKVVFASFHVDAQSPPMIDALFAAAVGRFETGPSNTLGVGQ